MRPLDRLAVVCLVGLIMATASAAAAVPGDGRHRHQVEVNGAGPAKAAARGAAANCRATDGDSLRCGKERVRVRNVYAAELKDRGGPEARAALQRQVDGKQVKIDRKARDRYGRTIADVYVGGRRVEQHDIGPRCGRGVKKARC